MTASSGLDLGLAIALSASELDDGLDKWLAPVNDGLFDSVWSLENPLSPQAEPLIWLTAAATLVPKARVGTAAMIAPIREPVLLARQAATLDRLTGGRLDLGVTIGRREAEYAATGADFRRRGKRLDEVIATLRRIWTDHDTTPGVGPAPARPGGPAILVGGHADVALARAVRLGDGFLAGATSGPEHALASARRLGQLATELDLEPPRRAVANVFVQTAPSVGEALDRAVSIFTVRHGGPPPWDPQAVVVAGPQRDIVHRLEAMHAGGFSGLNLVPVDMTLAGVAEVAAVAERLASLRSKA